MYMYCICIFDFKKVYYFKIEVYIYVYIKRYKVIYIKRTSYSTTHRGVFFIYTILYLYRKTLMNNEDFAVL